MCNSDSTCIEIQPVVADILEFNKSNLITVYPNPFQEQVTIELKDKNELFSFNVYNQAGILVYQEDSFANSFILKTEYLAKGVYILRFVTWSGEVSLVKIVKV
jgi:hypothetical protein